MLYVEESYQNKTVSMNLIDVYLYISHVYISHI